MSERFPGDFPPMTLAAQRVLCAVSQKSPEKLVPALDSLYRAFWVDENSKTANPEVFIPILERVLGKSETQEIIQAVCCTSKNKLNSFVLMNMAVESARHQVSPGRQHRPGIQIWCVWSSLV